MHLCVGFLDVDMCKCLTKIVEWLQPSSWTCLVRAITANVPNSTALPPEVPSCKNSEDILTDEVAMFSPASYQ